MVESTKGPVRFRRNFCIFWRFLAIFLCISVWSKLSAAQELHPHGINVCAYSESYIGTHITTSQMTRQTRTWDWGCLPFVRCKTKTVYFTMYRVSYLTRYRQVYRCCPGWLQDGDTCPIPTCDPECSEHGTCTGANYCTCSNGWRGPTCADRCPPGYMGANCVATCPAGKHGQDCLEDCRCQHGATCRGTDGFCNCTAGWRGEHCDVPCPGGTAGLDCELQCNCSQHGTCNPFTGDCLCDAGYHGALCESECSEGRYGPGCLFSCHCPGNNSVCRTRDGKCMCNPGWQGESCTIQCPLGYYGDQCSQKCGCNHGNSCDHVTGRCHCPPGYTGDNCESEIAPVLTAASTADDVSHGNVLVFYIIVAVVMGVLLILLVLSLAVCRRRGKACFHKRETMHHPMELETLMVPAPAAECTAVNEENRKNSFTQRQCMVVVKSGAPRKYTKLPDQQAGVSGAPPDVAGAVGGQVTFAEVAAAAKGTTTQQQATAPANLYEDVEVPSIPPSQTTVTVKKQPSFWQKLSRKGTRNDGRNEGIHNRGEQDDTIYEDIARVRKEAAKKNKKSEKKKKKAKSESRESSEPMLPTATPLPTTPEKNFYMPLVHQQTPLPRVTSIVSEGDRTSHIYAYVDYSKATTPASGAGDEVPVPASPGAYDYIGNVATPSRERMTGTSTDGAVSVEDVDTQPSYENVPKPANDDGVFAENEYVNDGLPYEEMNSVDVGDAVTDDEDKMAYETPRPLSERSNSNKTQYEDMSGSTPILDKISKDGKEGTNENEEGGMPYEKMAGGRLSLPDILL
ncbi:uncharacterized protein LOC144862872 [Branchiostoma floridae x Branchiostoma japonicum]